MTAKYGGNTTCIEVRCGEQILVIDAGTGIRALGDALLQDSESARVSLLFSHLHWDHIQGFPFFAPTYDPASRIDVYSGPHEGGDAKSALTAQMCAPSFPISMEIMAAKLHFHHFEVGETLQLGSDVCVRTAPLNHPGRATAFRIEYAGRVFVHASDHEHGTEQHQALIDLARGADVVSYDCTYTDQEYHGLDGSPGYVGWGHSTWQEGVRLAEAAGAEHLVIFHHDPSHTDKLLDTIVTEARERFPGSLVAAEGMQLVLGEGPLQVSSP